MNISAQYVHTFKISFTKVVPYDDTHSTTRGISIQIPLSRDAARVKNPGGQVVLWWA